MSADNIDSKMYGKHDLTRQFPEFQLITYAEKSHPYCVAVFVINEGERIRSQLRKMKPLSQCVDIIIADGGSTDGSLDDEFLRQQEVTALLVKKGPGRLSAQMRMAFAYALDQGYEGVIVIDGNDKDDTSAIPRFVDALERGHDHIQGSRYVPGGRGINTPLLRHLGVCLLHAPMISLAAGFRYTDTTNGFRAYSRTLLEDPRVQPFRDVFSHYELHYYLAIRAARLGYRVCELPVTRAYPRGGQIPTKIKSVSGNAFILKTLFFSCMGRFNP